MATCVHQCLLKYMCSTTEGEVYVFARCGRGVGKAQDQAWGAEQLHEVVLSSRACKFNQERRLGEILELARPTLDSVPTRLFAGTTSAAQESTVEATAQWAVLSADSLSPLLTSAAGAEVIRGSAQVSAAYGKHWNKY
jgi:hypothetical protein